MDKPNFINGMKPFNSYVFTSDKFLCMGCGACVQSCMQGALSMVADEEGFYYPLLNQDKCIACGLCDRVCPVTGTITENQESNQYSFVATTDNETYYQESASIGICTMLSEIVLSSGGYVFGVYLDEKTWTAYHIKISSEKDLYKIRNSKYLQSSTKSTYSEVKELLHGGKTVLYIGTPCQIGGLKAFLRKPYDSLYTIDIICHGVFSPMLMPLEVDYWEKKFGGKVKDFRFRSKRVYKYRNGGMVNFNLVREGSIKHVERFAGSSPTYRCYAYSGDGVNYNLRPACYKCPFRSYRRYGDITVGDPWFIPNEKIHNHQLRSSNTIRSIYSINTVKGKQLVQSIEHELIKEELPISTAFCQPATNKTNREIPQLRAELFKRCSNEDYGSLVESLLRCNLDESQKIFDRKYKKIKLRKTLKRILLWK